MPAASPSSPKPNRHWGQFGLRMLFFFMTLAAVCLGLFSYRMERAKRQAAAVSQMRDLTGGTICYDVGTTSTYISDGTSSTILFTQFSNSRPAFVPAWLERWLGIDFFGNVIEVASWNFPGRDSDLAAFKSFPKIKRIYLIFAPHVTDEGLAHLAGLRDLKELTLGNAPVTAEGIARLQRSLPKCRIVVDLTKQE